MFSGVPPPIKPAPAFWLLLAENRLTVVPSARGQAAVIFQQDNALAVDAVGQVGFRSADIVCRVIRRVVVKVQAIRLHLAVIPRLLVAQHGIDHAGIPGRITLAANSRTAMTTARTPRIAVCSTWPTICSGVSFFFCICFFLLAF